jgi:Berberine and berberine like
VVRGHNHYLYFPAVARLPVFPPQHRLHPGVLWRDEAGATGRAYLNFAAYGPEKFARLQALKDKWDPKNLFRHNQNIPPSAAALAATDPAT